jgi:hypothetical protein
MDVRMNKVKERMFLYPIIVVIIAVIGGIGLMLYTIKTGDDETKILVWEDKNQNGIKETIENGIPGVCVKSGLISLISTSSDYMPEYDKCVFKTNQKGEIAINFHTASCWDIYNSVIPPDGYAPTTSNLNTGCKLQVGLAKGSYTNNRNKYKEFVDWETTKQKITFWGAVLICSILTSELILWARKKTT